MATGPGPKWQVGGTVPGCEVAGWGLAQALVGDLHREEPQPARLIWNLPKSGGRAEKALQFPPALGSVRSCTLVTSETTSHGATAIPSPLRSPPTSPLRLPCASFGHPLWSSHLQAW